MTERVENTLGNGQGGSILIHVDREGTTKIIQRYRQVVWIRDSFLTQHVLETTRGEYVLDIVLSSQKEFY